MVSTVRELRLPDLGEGLIEAEIVRWLVDVGDVIAVDQPVVEVETAKATVEVPCPYPGVVTARHGAPGDLVDVGAPLLAVAPPESAPSSSGPVLIGFGTPKAEQRQRRSRLAAPAPAGPPVAVISPVVRHLARERGVDLSSVSGTGANGLILRSDVERAAAVERVPLRGIRAATAEKVSRSQREIPHVTCWLDADATGLLAVRAETEVPLLALLARICTAALARYPELNSTVDSERGEIVRLRAINLGIAVQTERGLLVPVIRDAQARTTEQLAADTSRVIAGARPAPWRSANCPVAPSR